MDFKDIPEQLKNLNSWIVWRLESPKNNNDKLIKRPCSALTKRAIDITDMSNCTNFESAVKAVDDKYKLGFVLSENDPFTFIDLDDCKGDKNVLKKQIEISNWFNSYQEISPSGSGLHIIVIGNVETGTKTKVAEIYSNKRFMTVTGNVYKNLPIVDYSQDVIALQNWLSPKKANNIITVPTLSLILSDEDIYNKAASAENGQKFRDLFAGNWQDYYSSQSEADLALVNILAFYTKDKDQIVKLFRYSQLGKRSKAKRVDYMQKMLSIAFDNEIPDIDFSEMNKNLETKIEIKKENNTTIKDISLDLPDSLVGELAQCIYEQSPRPVKEIALAGSIGLLAGISGRCFNISGLGLNQYILMLAETGTGKEAIANGIDKVMNEVNKTVPASSEFIGPSSISSAQAAISFMSTGKTSFVSIVGEFALYLQQMVGVKAPPHLIGLRRFMLDAYSKCGQNRVIRPTIYAEKEKNTGVILSPAFTLLGESTPERFYEGLNENLMLEGLLPRFTIIQYKGKRPKLNEDFLNKEIPNQLITNMATLAAYCLQLNAQNNVVQIAEDIQANTLFREFNNYCDEKMDHSTREVGKVVWSRSHVKALKIAGLLAVGCNPYNPIITKAQAMWAINLISFYTEQFGEMFDSGEIGTDNNEIKQHKETLRVISEYLCSSWTEIEKYAVGNLNLFEKKIIPYSYLHKRLCRLSIFKGSNLGVSGMIKATLKTLCEKGTLQEIDKVIAARMFDTSGICYILRDSSLLNEQ